MNVFVNDLQANRLSGGSVNSVAGGQLRTRAPRVGFLTQWYPPEPTTLPGEFAHGVQDPGWNVRVLTGFPNYPSGKVHEGYANRLPQKETIDGVPVLRTPLYPSHDRSAVRRILNYLTGSASATIGHGSVLESVSVNPSAVISGEVTIGEGTLVGAAGTILQGLTIGERSVIAAGAVVTKDAPPAVVVNGVPGGWT